MVREGSLTIHFQTFGKPGQLYSAGRWIVRNVNVKLHGGVISASLNGEEMHDDFSDDKGEMWHTLDWKTEKAEEEFVEPHKDRIIMTQLPVEE